MKTKYYLYVAFSFLTGLFLQRANGQANTELSNLVSPTKVNQSLNPTTTNSKDLGTTSESWRIIYLAGSIYLDGKRFLSNENDSSKVFIGSNAGNKRVAKTGRFNTATGYYALYSYTTGWDNTATGSRALFSNTTGSYNTANGREALYSNTNGAFNTANGRFALFENTTGDGNTANGDEALYSNTTGVLNTASGVGAGSYNNNNTFCTFIGFDADQSVTTDFTNSTALGNKSLITASNQVRIGNSSVISIGGYEPWTNLSDGRFKKNVNENVPGLLFINQLHAITYTMDVTKLRNFLGEDRQNETATAGGKTLREKNPEAEALIQKGIQEKEKIIHTGFVAQEVEEAAKKIGYDFSGVDKPQNEHTPYGLRYSEFVVPLVKAVQELSKISEGLRTENDELKSEIRNLTAEIDKLKFAIGSGNSLSASSSSASLAQNVPNPVTNATTIKYT